MNNQSLVSVLIPAYNHEKYIQETINSIINQTYQPIELIIVDDGSKDSTWQKIQELKEKCEQHFVRIHFETKQNEGTCQTLNKLISLAKGDFLYLIASDDLAEPKAIAKEIDFLKEHPDYVLVVGDNRFIDQDSQLCGWDEQGNIQYAPSQIKYATFAACLQKNAKLDFTGNNFGTYAQLYLGNHIPNGYLFRKSAMDAAGQFTPQAPLEDYWLMLQLAKQGKMKFLDEILFSYRQHPKNTIKNKEKMYQMDRQIRLYEQNLLKELDKKGTLSQSLQKVLYNGVLIKEKNFLGFKILKYYQYKKYIYYLTFMGKTIYTYVKFC